MPALIVAPDAGFDSYVSESEADAYMLAVGYGVEWNALDEDAKRANLRRGSQYIGAQRLLATAIEPEVHANVIAATCEAAIRAKRGLLYKDQSQQAVKSVTVGPIKREYADPVSPSSLRFQIIDDLLYGLTVTGVRNGPIFLERA